MAAVFGFKVQQTSDLAELEQCAKFVVYLTALTWRSGATSTAFADEVRMALDAEIPLLLVHEMPGVGGQEARHGCEFGTFFGHPEGATPADLLKRGIYSTIAVALKGAEWREASMVLLAQALSAGGIEETELDDVAIAELKLAQMTTDVKRRVRKTAGGGAKLIRQLSMREFSRDSRWSFSQGASSRRSLTSESDSNQSLFESPSQGLRALERAENCDFKDIQSTRGGCEWNRPNATPQLDKAHYALKISSEKIDRAFPREAMMSPEATSRNWAVNGWTWPGIGTRRSEWSPISLEEATTSLEEASPGSAASETSSSNSSTQVSCVSANARMRPRWYSISQEEASPGASSSKSASSNKSTQQSRVRPAQSQRPENSTPPPSAAPVTIDPVVEDITSNSSDKMGRSLATVFEAATADPEPFTSKFASQPEKSKGQSHTTLMPPASPATTSSRVHVHVDRLARISLEEASPATTSSESVTSPIGEEVSPAHGAAASACPPLILHYDEEAGSNEDCNNRGSDVSTEGPFDDSNKLRTIESDLLKHTAASYIQETRKRSANFVDVLAPVSSDEARAQFAGQMRFNSSTASLGKTFKRLAKSQLPQSHARHVTPSHGTLDLVHDDELRV